MLTDAVLPAAAASSMAKSRVEASMADWDSLLDTISTNKSILRLAYLMNHALKSKSNDTTQS